MNIHQILDDLKAVFSRLDAAITALEGSDLSSRPRRGRPPKSPSARPATRKRPMSPAARKRIGAAKKAWWVKQKGKGAPKKAAAPGKKAPVRKPMSPAAKKRLSNLAKARWAAAKKAGASSL
jgi:hypothetical protein